MCLSLVCIMFKNRQLKDKYLGSLVKLLCSFFSHEITYKDSIPFIRTHSIPISKSIRQKMTG